jgi:hypothetical protein
MVFEGAYFNHEHIAKMKLADFIQHESHVLSADKAREVHKLSKQLVNGNGKKSIQQAEEGGSGSDSFQQH